MTFGNLVRYKFVRLVSVLESTRWPRPLDFGGPPACSLEPKRRPIPCKGTTPARAWMRYDNARAVWTNVGSAQARIWDAPV